jgi:hypothetical protein
MSRLDSVSSEDVDEQAETRRGHEVLAAVGERAGEHPRQLDSSEFHLPITRHRPAPRGASTCMD